MGDAPLMPWGLSVPMRTVLLVFLVAAPAVWAQSAAPTCEHQVGEQYQSLVRDQLLPTGSEATWSPQLLVITSQIRIRRNQYELKKNQAELAEQNWLQTNESLRQALQENATLKAEVERLKPPPTEPSAAK